MISSFHGQMPKVSAFGQGMCHDDGCTWEPFTNHFRQQRKMIVLHQDDRIRTLRLFHNGRSKPCVDGAIFTPVRSLV
jgi:hypothetical protein